MHTESIAQEFRTKNVEVSETGAVEVKERTVEQKIADAVATCAAVAKLYKRYGGAFVPMPANKPAKGRVPFKMPPNPNVRQIKRTLKLEKPVRVPRYLFCSTCKQPFLGASDYRCQCKASVQRKLRRAG